MFLFLLSLTGIPPTAGFAAKFARDPERRACGLRPLAVLAVACSVVSAFFYLRMAVLMYMTEPQGLAPGRFLSQCVCRTGGRRGGHVIGGLVPDTLRRVDGRHRDADRTHQARAGRAGGPRTSVDWRTLRI